MCVFFLKGTVSRLLQRALKYTRVTNSALGTKILMAHTLREFIEIDNAAVSQPKNTLLGN